MTSPPNEPTCPLCETRLRNADLQTLGLHFTKCPRTDWVQRKRRS